MKFAPALLAFIIPVVAAAQTTPAPSASPQPAPSASASPAPAASPSPAPTPLPTPLVLPPEAPPQILAIQVNEPVFHSGDTVSATVITSTNVPAVELRVMGKIIRFQRVNFGIFQLA